MQVLRSHKLECFSLIFLASLLRNFNRKVFLFDVKQFRFLFAAPSSQRTIEETETDHSAADGNSSSDDPLNLSAKRFVRCNSETSRLTKHFSFIAELCLHERVALIVPSTCLAPREVRRLLLHQRQATTAQRNLITPESLTSPNPNQLTRTTQRPTQKTLVIRPAHRRFASPTVLWSAINWQIPRRQWTVIYPAKSTVNRHWSTKSRPTKRIKRI